MTDVTGRSDIVHGGRCSPTCRCRRRRTSHSARPTTPRRAAADARSGSRSVRLAGTTGSWRRTATRPTTATDCVHPDTGRRTTTPLSASWCWRRRPGPVCRYLGPPARRHGSGRWHWRITWTVAASSASSTTWSSRSVDVRDDQRTLCHTTLDDWANEVAWRSGDAFCLTNEVTPGPVSTWMFNCLWAVKLRRYVTSHQGRLSLLPYVGWQSEYQLSGWVVINGDGECRTTIAASLGGSVAHADWLGPKVGGRPALCCIRPMNRVNSRSCCVTMTAT